MKAMWKFSLELRVSVLGRGSVFRRCPDGPAAEVANLPCLPTQKTCTCANEGIEMDMASSKQMNFTIREPLTIKNLAMTNCDAPVRDVSTQPIILSNTVEIIACVRLAKRIILKPWWNFRLEIDDWWILIASSTGIPGVIVTNMAYSQPLEPRHLDRSP
ncbi:hypothetical protein BKA56DRAFT_623447 [Ilyonectria sp. MPI-CAGE-AT-0026]|nr:hypothetical protein BKA56DRAFT_623447 [Ilyonectria sp. MPI-CAGE-AT-0026]